MNDSHPSKPERRWYQVSLKLLMVTGILGVLLGLWGNEKKWELREGKAKSEIRKLGGKIIPAEMGIVYYSVEQVWLNGTGTSDDDLVHLGQLRYPYRIDLSNTNISDAGLEHLKQVTRLKRLDLSGTQVTERGVRTLQQALPNCKISH